MALIVKTSRSPESVQASGVAGRAICHNRSPDADTPISRRVVYMATPPPGRGIIAVGPRTPVSICHSGAP
ncbi:MAG: hypothetical protein ACREE7_19310, partial [Dongiaceae bacterium]